ncbi:CDP-alcohol phosphatidyltransferase [Penicillium malachiteum]|nr:CDP-alcohol phosphatidyltransferase [Penicillium malachiteum]
MLSTKVASRLPLARANCTAGSVRSYGNLVCHKAILHSQCISTQAKQPLLNQLSRPAHSRVSLASAPRTLIAGSFKRWTSSKTPDGPNEESKTTAAAKRLLSKLPIAKTHENIYTVPNILTFTRLVAAPVVGYLLVHEYHTAALSLFAYAGITDLVDGYIARKYNLQTVVGTIIDPMADKLLMTIGVACLAVNGSLPVWLAVIILGRDIGLALSAIYYRWISLPAPKTMARYWDFSLPSAEVKPTEISKINTALQLVLVGSAISLPVLPEAFISAWHLQEAMTGFQYLVAGTTIWSGLSYVFSKNAVKILSNEEIQKRIAAAAAKKKD